MMFQKPIKPISWAYAVISDNGTKTKQNQYPEPKSDNVPKTNKPIS
jgi:hypothetical protein